MNKMRQTSNQPFGSQARTEIMDMRTKTRSYLSLAGLLVALATVVGISILLLATATAVAAPADAPAAQPARGGMAFSSLPANTCTVSATLRTCELWAMTGTITTATGDPLPIWGFADQAAGPAQLPGPMLIANAGETLEVVLHNQVPTETVSLTFPGQRGLMPDLTGVASGGTVTYTFAVTNPGTFLYEAGLTPNGMRQVAMGLYGGLIVRPVTPTQAYDDPVTGFQDEVLLVLSEIDPFFNLDPYGFVMTEYQPRYWLINGKSYPETAEIQTTRGNTILMRYINAGLESHWMGALSLQQQIIATDGRPKALPRQVVAETIASGETVDALIGVPADTVTNTRFALYDTNTLLHNANQRYTPNGPLAFGGMMTFIRTVSGTVASAAGPVASNVQVSPSPTTGDVGVTLSATLTSASGVTAAEFFTNSLGAAGTGIDMALGGGGATYNIPAATLAGWPSGFIEFYVRGQDANGWGPVGSAILNLDKVGPNSTSMSLWPQPTNGNYTVMLRATGDDHGTGRNNVVAATYSVDGGAALPLSLSRTDAPIVAMTTTLPSSPTLQGMAEGLHPITVIAQDSLGNLGAPSVITLTLDKTGPEAPLVSLTPDLLDLTQPLTVTTIRLDADMVDALWAGVQTTLAKAEAFVGEVGPDDTGFDLFPSDGLFDEISEAAYFDIPVANFSVLAQGVHTVTVHALDAAGNWGSLGSATITVNRGGADLVGPTVTALDVTPNPTRGAVTVTLTAAAADPGMVSNVAAGEWFVGADPGPGFGLPLQAVDGAFDSPSELLRSEIVVSGWGNGQYVLSVRARDSANNWGGVASVRLRVLGNNAAQIMADSFEAGNLDAWNAAQGQVAVVPEAAMAPDGGMLGLQATVDGGAVAYLSYLMPTGETNYRATFYFDPNGIVLGSDEHDILVGLNSGTPIFGIQCEASGSRSGYEIRAWAVASGVSTFTDWHDLSDDAHKLSLKWEAKPDGAFSLAIDDVIVEELTGLNTATYVLHEIHLGPSTNLDAAVSGAEYFDGFDARRMVLLQMPAIYRQQ
jgi:hypothetical protein